MKSATGRWILVATMLASGTSFLFGTALYIALPDLQSYFATDLAGVQWVVNGYLLSLASLLLIGGSVGDFFGRKRIFLLGMFLLSGGAVLAGLSRSIAVLVIFQVIIGIGAALMIPQSLAIINACFEEKERGQAIGLWAGLSGGISAAGPWLGGWLVSTFSWRAVFFLIVPFMMVSILVTGLFVWETRLPSRGRLDWQGTLLVLAGLLGLAYGLITGPGSGWMTAPVLAALLLGIFALVFFILLERRQPSPIVPLRIFKIKLVAGANLSTIFLYFALNGLIFLLPLNLQQAQGYSPAVAGLALLPTTLLITFGAGPAGRLSDRIGPRLQMIWGPFTVAAGVMLLAISGARAFYFQSVFPGLMLVGAGMATVIAPLTKSALAVEKNLSGAASGVSNAVARVAALLAIAVLGAIMLSVFSQHLTAAAAGSGLTAAQQQQLTGQAGRLGGIIVPDNFPPAAAAAAHSVIKNSFIYAFRWAAGICTTFGLIAGFISIRYIKNKP